MHEYSTIKIVSQVIFFEKNHFFIAPVQPLTYFFTDGFFRRSGSAEQQDDEFVEKECCFD